MPPHLQRDRHPPRWVQRWAWGLGSSAVALSFPIMALSAERLYFAYGVIQRSVPISSLERYAAEGVIDRPLRDYTRFFSEAQLAQLRPALSTKADISHVAIAQFLYTPQGETLLEQIGALVQPESGQSGFYALRAALILAADSEEGLTLLNVLKMFPTYGIQIDLAASLELTTALRQAINQTDAAVKLIQQEAQTEAQQVPVSLLPPLPAPNQPGMGTWRVHSEVLYDGDRDRTIPVDYYIPQPRPHADAAAPVPATPAIVISHGLGNDRDSYAYLAEHLASYGFLVIVPEHPGSGAEQIDDLVRGYVSELADPQEFINRPLDVTFLLDDLATRHQTAPFAAIAINREQVGVIGQSFGGYTALALAGAPIDAATLDRDCQTTPSALNLSVLLQCQAQVPAAGNTDLRDPRIVAAIALNPVGSLVFGPQGFQNIQVPLLIVTGNADTVAPALAEQIRPFTWLTQSPAPYLALLQGGTHFSTIAPGSGDVVALPAAVIGPSPEVAQEYVNVLSLSFAEVHVANNAAYAPFLTAAYGQQLSHSVLPLSLITSLSPSALKAAIANTAVETGLPK